MTNEEQIKDLMQKSIAAYEGGKSILSQAREKGEVLSTEKSAEVDRAFDEAERFKALADQCRRENDLEKGFDAPVNGLPHVGNEGQKATSEIHGKSVVAYLKNGFAAMKPEEQKALSTVSDPDGGFLVRTEMATAIRQKMRDLVYIRSRADVIATSANQMSVPTFEEDVDEDLEVAENAETSDSSPSDVFGKTTLTPHKQSKLFKVSTELLEDSIVNVESFLIDHFATKFAEKEERRFISGNGVDQPLGILSASLNAVDLDDAGNAISAEDILDAVYDVRAVYRSRGMWLMPRSVIRRVRKIRDDSGASAGTGTLMWQMGLQAGQPATLAGYPVAETEFMKDPFGGTGADGDSVWVFGDWFKYMIVDRTQLTVQRLVERFAEFGQVGILMTRRMDATPVDRDAFVRYNRN